MTAVATHIRLANALDALVNLADRHEPEWMSATGLAAYRAAVLEGRLALLAAEQDEPVSADVVELPASPGADLGLVGMIAA